MSSAQYIIGIDLGTTNSVVSYTRAELEPGQTPEIRILQIPQSVEAGVVENRDILPSFILAPGPHDVPDGALDLPWPKEEVLTVGEFARKRGAELPQRLISSAKSWLCHPLVDRNKAILPWKSPADCPKLSPVAASAEILKHIRQAWDYQMARSAEGHDESLLMENQDILLTVPASFDAVARDLTIQAARLAGLENVTLLEEPQAAFYSWIATSDDAWREAVSVGDLVLVFDIGGGTSDFSLIQISERDGELDLERIAVGEHLLVGGDNMDLSLAYHLSKRLADQGKRLDTHQMQGLWHGCRTAKEDILSENGPENRPIAILGSGSKLIGGTLRVDMTREDAESVIMEGFFPLCDRADAPATGQQAGIKEFGLSYEADPCVSRHLARFISRQDAHLEKPTRPTAVLFNGGVMKADPLRKRVLTLLNSWQEGQGMAGAPVREITATDFDLAVARGAAYYGLARRGHGVRIRGGLGKSYYLGIAAAMPAVPGMPAPTRALCLAPFGMEEGTRAVISSQEFVLVVGEPVTFDFLGAATRFDDAPGVIIDDWEGQIEPITTLETTLDGEKGTAIPVTLEIAVTEIGTLEVWCVSQDSGQKWKLEFNVRERQPLDE
jgi:molecular chaperone DnaK (HSP70)